MFSLLEKFLTCANDNKICVLCTVVSEEGSTPRGIGATMLVFDDRSIEGSVGGGISEAHVIARSLEMVENGEEVALFSEKMDGATTEHPELHAVCGGTVSVFMQSSVKKNRLFIFGAGHVGRALACISAAAGFEPVTWDEREEFANAKNIPFGKTICCPIGEALEKMKPTASSFVVVATRGHALDTEAIRLLENLEVKYIGVIGSRSKIAFVREKLLSEGVAEKHLDRLFQPVGLPIKAETPEEIAISIVAELIAVKNGADIKHLRGVLNS